MRIILLIIVIGLLLVGWLGGRMTFSLSGALLFISISSSDLVAVYRASKLYRKGIDQKEDEKEKKRVSKILEKWLSGAIVISGLIALCFGIDKQDHRFVTGGIIWIGTIVIWAASGVIVSIVAGIPLRMGYSGWYVHRPSKRQKRGYSRSRKNIGI